MFRTLRARLMLLLGGMVLACALVFAAVVVGVLAVDRRDEGPTEESDDTEDDIERVAFAMAVASPVLVVVAIGAGWFAARRALQPMRDATARAKAARSSELDVDLPVRGAGDEWDELAVTMNTLLADGRRALSRLTRFTADAAHELRTPLTAIIGTAEVALRREREAPEYRRALEESLAEARRLARLVDSLLTLSRADAHVLISGREPLALDELAAAAVRRVLGRGAPGARSVHLTFANAPVRVLGDSQLLGRLLDNVLENAVVHGGGEIEVRMASSRGRAVVEFTDAGPGIPAELAPRLFDRFARADASRATPGFGLGLSIARAIAEAHQGQLTLEKSVRGALFRLELPLSPEVGRG